MAGLQACLIHAYVFLELFTSAASGILSKGMLFPRESESRQIQELDGMWHFRADRSPSRDEGMVKEWYLKSLSEVCFDIWHMPYVRVITSKHRQVLHLSNELQSMTQK